MSFKYLLAAVVVAFPMVARAAANTPYHEMPSGAYIAEPSHTSLTWKVSHLGLSNYTARFTKITADLNFDAKDPTKSTLDVTVDPTSVKTDFPFPEKTDFDAKLAKGAEWFNADVYKTIHFKATRIELTGEKTGLIHGDLTFLGETKPLTLNATFNGAYAKAPFSEVPMLGFSATATLQRSNWGMISYLPDLGNDVQLLIEAEFVKK